MSLIFKPFPLPVLFSYLSVLHGCSFAQGMLMFSFHANHLVATKELADTR